jgi:hypothetical protein
MTPFPTHPFTGLTAIGFRRDGRPIYPIRGGSQPTPPVPTPPPGSPAPTPAPTNPPAPTDAGDQPLGPPGQKALAEERAALAAERETRKALEKQLAELAPLKQIADIITGGQKPPDGKSEAVMLNERLEKYESDLASERTARWRAEVASAKGLTADQAAWISGATAEEFAASADRLLASFSAAPAGPRNPAPDPSQGARGGQPGPDLAAQTAEAVKSGDWRKAAALQKTKLADIKR